MGTAPPDMAHRMAGIGSSQQAGWQVAGVQAGNQQEPPEAVLRDDRQQVGGVMEPTICAKCKYYTAAIHSFGGLIPIDFPAYCWHKPGEPSPDYVTGKPKWLGPVRCYQKNLGSCADYEFKPPEPLFTIAQDKPRKHWWQK